MHDRQYIEDSYEEWDQSITYTITPKFHTSSDWFFDELDKKLNGIVNKAINDALRWPRKRLAAIDY